MVSVPSDKRVAVPDVRGLSIRRALSRLAIDKLESRIQGSGTVIRQIPPAGGHADPGSTVTLFCEPSTLAVEHNRSH